jgi:hypothetical protein
MIAALTRKKLSARVLLFGGGWWCAPADPHTLLVRARYARRESLFFSCVFFNGRGFRRDEHNRLSLFHGTRLEVVLQKEI